MLLQLELVEWTMEDGQELYARTDDLLATPPIFTMAPGESQIVRVGLRHPVSGSLERSYRLFLQEPPQQRQASNDEMQELRMTLRVGIPVFVAPSIPSHADLRWRAARARDGTIRIKARNDGNVHARLLELSLVAAGGQWEYPIEKGSAYLLPDHTRHWTVGPGLALPESSLSLRARTEDSAIDIELKAGSE
jgi:fimbrial chaperone protein